MFNVIQEKARCGSLRDKSLQYSFLLKVDNVAAKWLIFLLCIYKAQLRISLRPANQERFVNSVSTSRKILE